MIESKFGNDKSLIFKETLNDAYSVANNRYAKGTVSATGVRFEDGVAKITTGGSITYKLSCNAYPFNVNGLTIRCKGFLKSTGDYIFNLRCVGAGQISLQRSGTFNLYNNPQAATIDLSQYFNSYINIVITYGGSVNSKFYINGEAIYNIGDVAQENNRKQRTLTLNSAFDHELFEIHNRTLSASEVKLLYQNQLYVEPTNLPLLLDFDSTRGVIEDKTELNTLTSTDVDIKRIGKVYSAYLNGTTSSHITISQFKENPRYVIFWVNVSNTKDTDCFGKIETWSLRLNNNSISTIGGSTPTQVIVFNKLGISLINKYILGWNLVCIELNVIQRDVNYWTLFRIGYLFRNGKSYISSLKVIPDLAIDLNILGTQLYNSQKGQFGL